MADTEIATTNGGQVAPPLNLKGLNLKQIYFIGEQMHKSGMFSDVRDASMALVKILAGQEIGVTPFQAMTNIHIIQGKATMSANLMAGKLKGSGKYDYRMKLSSQSCTVTIYELVDGKRDELGEFTFTMDDAQRAGLVKPGSGWTKYPQNMLFARAISTAVRMYAPDVFNGNVVYSPDEMGGEIDDAGEYTGRTIIDNTPAPTPQPTVADTDDEVEDDSTDTTTDAQAVADLMTDDDDTPAEVVALADDEHDVPTPDPELSEDDAKFVKSLKFKKAEAMPDVLKAEFETVGITDRDKKIAYVNHVLGKDMPDGKDEYIKVITAIRSGQ